MAARLTLPRALPRFLNRPILRSHALTLSRFQTNDAAAAAPTTSPTNNNNGSINPQTASISNSGLNDSPFDLDVGSDPDRIDWARSFHGLSTEAFPKEVSDVLMAPLDPDDVEIKPDGIVYLPEIKYRRILNRAFGPGGWGLAPRGEHIVTDKVVTREYALVCLGRLVSVARGEQDYFDQNGIPMATEGCKSNALMRCCKDLGIASELWDPRFLRKIKKEKFDEKFGEHITTKRKKKVWVRKGDPLPYPYR